MSHAILLSILHISEREKSKITSLAITPNRSGDTPKQRGEMSHYNFSDLILPYFMIF
jgi:hypothetical protein